MTGIISDLKRFAVHDGDGIRTTVFFKGCPLNCLWCHNPESIPFAPQAAYYETKCITCGECVPICPAGAHRLAEEGHLFLREKCIGCGECEKVCLGDAIKHYGKKYTVEALLPLLLEDRAFYENSGGGVTLSGGECLCQADFCAALLAALKKEGIHTAVDTCGFVSRASLEKVIPYTDLFLYDVKAVDPEVHLACTGKSNTLILENLRYLDRCGKSIEVRIPFVPGYNDGEMERIASLLGEVKHLTGVRILPYHNYAGSKYHALAMKNTLPERLPEEDELQKAEAFFALLPLRK